MTISKKNGIAIIGSGPAGLMCAEVLSTAGLRALVFEKNPGLGRKLLIAGSSGLNIGSECTQAELLDQYCGRGSAESGWGRRQWQELFDAFSPQDWLRFVRELGLEPFKGSSRRYFVKDGPSLGEVSQEGSTNPGIPAKASGLLGRWVARLKERGVEFRTGHEFLDFSVGLNQVAGRSTASDQLTLIMSPALNAPEFSAIVLCLGGGSWEKQPPQWPEILIRKGIAFESFRPANAGYQVDWAPGFLNEAEGLPLKGISLRTARGSRRGELMITRYGLEGTPVYAIGCPGLAHVDLRPELSARDLIQKLSRSKENLSPLRRAQKLLDLPGAAQALLYHHAPKGIRDDLVKLCECIKSFPIQFKESQPLQEAISSDGGVHLAELTSFLMLRKFPGVFAAGEMLNWSAPTGGFLIQACISQGAAAGRGVLEYLRSKASSS